MKYRVYIPPNCKRAQMDCMAPKRCGFVSHTRVGDEWKCSVCGNLREWPWGGMVDTIETALQLACEEFNALSKSKIGEHGEEIRPGLSFWDAVEQAGFKYGVSSDDLQYALSMRSAQARAKAPEKPEKPLPYKDE